MSDLQEDKVPGPDELFLRLLKELSEEINLPITMICRGHFLTERFQKTGEMQMYASSTKKEGKHKLPTTDQ